MDLILQWVGDATGVLHEHKWVPFMERDKKEGYSNSQHQQLMEKVEEVLMQLEMRQYCGLIKDHITKLHEYGLAFLGPYCTVVSHSLEWKQGGPWVIKNTYSLIEDENHHKLLYTSQTS